MNEQLGVNFEMAELTNDSVSRKIDDKIDSPYDYTDRINDELSTLAANLKLLTPLNLKMLKEGENALVTCGDVIIVANSMIRSSTTGSYERSVAATAGLDNKDYGECKNCVWCGEALGDVSEKTKGNMKENYYTFCSFECAEKQRLRAGSTQIRSQLFSLERGVCQQCNLDCHALWKHVKSLQPSERLNKLLGLGFAIPKSGAALQKLLGDPKECDFWQADHKLAVALGGGLCGIDNFQTLCTTCHKVDSGRLRRALVVGTGSKHGEVGSRDIVEMIGEMEEAVEEEKKKKRGAVVEVDLTISSDDDDDEEEVEEVVVVVKKKKKKKRRRAAD